MSNIALTELRWPSLARDLAVMYAPDTPITDLSIIYSTYNLDEPTLASILTVPKFQAMYRKALEEMKAQGAKAGSMYRAGTLAQALSEKLFNDAADGKMKSGEAIKLLELFLKAGGLLEKEAAATVNVQNNVGISLPLPRGLTNPKLKHIDTPVKAVGA